MSENQPAVSCHEVRLLEGANLYFTRPALKVVLALPGPAAASADAVADLGRRVGLGRVARTQPHSDARLRVLARIVERVVRALTRAAGVTRLGVRVRLGSAPDEVVVAAVWRHRGRALALGEALTPAVHRLWEGESLEAVASDLAAGISSAPAGAPARVVTPRIPVVAVTGTNGKTTTTRLLAHIGMTDGRMTAWSSTDGVLSQGHLVEPGDYSGPAGARAVLDSPGVQLGILETARGGMLLKGLGVTHNDVSVVTNVSADHLGQQGIDTVDQLAEVKAIITKVTRPRGWCVLNGDDPRVWAMRTGTKARPWVFTLDPDSPAIREAIGAGGRAITVVDGALTVLDERGASEPLVPVVDLPMALSGLSIHNVANALAGAAAALAIGLPKESVVAGLRSFAPDDRLNPGRMNTYSVPVPDGSATVIVDLAHNEAGLDALLDVAHGLVAPGSKVRLGLGTAGDRTDDILRALGEIAGRRADHVVLAHKEHYLRGRTIEEMEAPLREGLAEAGVAHADSTMTEVDGVAALLADAHDGDVIAIMCHSDRVGVAAHLASLGGTSDGPSQIRDKVLTARGEHPQQAAIDALWEMEDGAERIARARELYAASPSDAVLAYEYAGTYDSAGEEESAVPLYEAALAAGLREPLRHRCLIQLASTLRNLGRHEEALARIDEAAILEPSSVGTAMFRAMIQHDAGDPSAALRDLLGVLATESTDADVTRYRRALGAYAQTLGEPQA